MKILLFWPFILIFKLVEAIIKLTGVFLALILGLVFMAIGFLLTLTIVGAILGIPLIILGIGLIIKGIF